jgi:DMSO/TMAO reductase YedYZ molybdopterin-dependent catalytic subunit
MSPISRRFRGQRPLFDGARVPPGHHVVDEFPVLSVGSTPHRPLDEWTFRISGAVDEPISWTWDELLALPAETPTVDIHCVTAGRSSTPTGTASRLTRSWRGWRPRRST